MTLGGRAIALRVTGKANRKLAVEAWHRLVVNGTPAWPDAAPSGPTNGPGAKTQAPTAPTTPTVAGVVDGYLAHQDERVKPETVRWLRRFLGTFEQKFGVVLASGIAPHDSESWAARKG